MHIIVVGLNYRTAPVELRERVSLSDVELDDVLAQMRDTRTVMESVILSTCNRTEVYAVVSSAHAGEDYLKTFFTRRSGLPAADLEPHLYVHTGQASVTHLMRVASGLDSMVIGETQILGQVRNAFLTASDVGNTGVLLNQLFRSAIHLGKRAQTETTIGQSPVSVSYAAVQLAKKIYGELKGCKALILGAGKMGRLTAQHLSAAGVDQLLVVNRTYERACNLADEFGGVAYPWDQLSDALAQADIVISSTGSKATVLHANEVQAAVEQRHRRPFVLIDIAVPRDIDPTAGQVANVYLYDIDDLEGVVAANLAERKRQAEEVERMIEAGLIDYSKWLSEQEVVPLIAAIRAKGSEIQAAVMESLQRKLPELDERQLKLIHKHTMSIVNQILRDPVSNMKELAIASGGAQHVKVFAQLFGITEEHLRDVKRQGASMVGFDAVEDASFVRVVKEWSEQLLREESLPARPSLHAALR